MNFERVDGFMIECRTGCSCCSNENHYRGPFKTAETAQEKAEEYRAMPLLASQYARRGHYHINPIQIEILPDGRLILDGERVVAGFRIQEKKSSTTSSLEKAMEPEIEKDWWEDPRIKTFLDEYSNSDEAIEYVSQFVTSGIEDDELEDTIDEYLAQFDDMLE